MFYMYFTGDQFTGDWFRVAERGVPQDLGGSPVDDAQEVRVPVAVAPGPAASALPAVVS